MVLPLRPIAERRREMIKAEDLRIGDLVRYGKDVISIQAVHTNYEEGFIKDKYNVGYNCDELDPIPLTPEILEKNGFEMREGTVVYAKNRLALKPLDEGKGYQVYQVGLGSLRLFYVEVRFVKYVHELQHILWALGKDTNLKV